MRSETDDEKMKELYATHLRQVRSLMEFRDNFDFLEIEYRNMIDDPERNARRIASFLGADLDIEKMTSVVDPTHYRNRAEAS